MTTKTFFFVQLYENEEALSEIAPCMFISNVRVKFGSAKYILRKGADMEISNWYAHWWVSCGGFIKLTL